MKRPGTAQDMKDNAQPCLRDECGAPTKLAGGEESPR